MKSKGIATLIALCGGGAMLASMPRASADIVHAYYINSQLYDYEVSHMPDFDQRRAAASGIVGLPNNGGMYCVPTSSTNMLAYIANHGFSQVAPGAGNWQSNTRYNDAGNAILALGNLMGTDANDGTGGNGWFAGLFVWLLPYNKFVVTQNYAASYYCPTVATMAKTAAAGSLVAFAYGRYELTQDNGDVLIVGDRTGGHIVTLSKAQRSGDARLFRYRDPADDSADLYSQSAFSNREIDTGEHIVSGPGFIRMMSSLGYPWDDDRARLIDGYVAVRPKAGYSFKNTGPQLNLEFLRPIKLLTDMYPTVTEIASPTGLPYVDVALHPDGADFLVLTEGSGGGPRKLSLLDLFTGEGTQLAEVTDGLKLFFGPRRELYVLCDGSVRVYDIDQAGAPLVTTETLPYPAQAMTFNDAGPQLVLLSISDAKLLMYREGLGVAPTVLDLPTSVPLAGDGSVSINPLDGKFWIVTSASESLYGLRQLSGGGFDVEEVSLPAVQMPTSLDFDDGGHMFVSTANGIVELENPTGRVWQVVSDSEFAGLPVGPELRMTRSRTNFDPATMSGPAYFNLLPEETLGGTDLPDGRADLNCDGTVDFGDINPFVTALSDPVAYARLYPDCYRIHGDINGDGSVDFGDINPFVECIINGGCP